MFGMEARRLGYRVHVFEPSPNGPALQVADRVTSAPYDDLKALGEFARTVDVATFEFENVPASAVEAVAEHCPVRPRGEVLRICQNREREKTFLHSNGFPHVPYMVVTGPDKLELAIGELGDAGVLKTADFGYDGKGQIRPLPGETPEEIWARFGAPRGVWEKWISFECELSVVCARDAIGQTACFAVAENIHEDHILDLSIVPARVPDDVKRSAARLACRVADSLDVVGLLAVEMFLLPDRSLCVNELAPRPHNSGHFSFDACITSQFEQQLRAVCGLPLGDPTLVRPVVMANLLGDLWKNGEPDWTRILREPNAKLHLYGKDCARPGRKMGHFCVMDDTVEVALANVRRIRKAL